jgi:hypothetical protein
MTALMTRSRKRASLETAGLLAVAGILIGLFYVGPLELSFRAVFASAAAGLAFVGGLAVPALTLRRFATTAVLALASAVAGGLGGAVWALIMQRPFPFAILIGAGLATIAMAAETRGFKDA